MAKRTFVLDIRMSEDEMRMAAANCPPGMALRPWARSLVLSAFRPVNDPLLTRQRPVNDPSTTRQRPVAPDNKIPLSSDLSSPSEADPDGHGDDDAWVHWQGSIPFQTFIKSYGKLEGRALLAYLRVQHPQANHVSLSREVTDWWADERNGKKLKTVRGIRAHLKSWWKRAGGAPPAQAAMFDGRAAGPQLVRGKQLDRLRTQYVDAGADILTGQSFDEYLAERGQRR